MKDNFRDIVALSFQNNEAIDIQLTFLNPEK